MSSDSSLLALILGIGMIIYISAVNDEVARRKKPPPNAPDEFRFHYYYGWDILFAATGKTQSIEKRQKLLDDLLVRF